MRSEKLCFCGSGRAQSDCHPEIGPESMVAGLYRLQYEIDGEIELQKKERLLISPCRAGCGECCSRCFCVSETEFAQILHYLLKASPPPGPRLRELVGKSCSQWERLETDCPRVAEKLSGAAALKELLELASLSLPFPCIFLDGQSRCTVYPVRPLVCRLHGIAYANYLPGCGGQPCSLIPDGCSEPGDFADLSDYSGRLLRFILLADEDRMLVRRPEPLFYYFQLLFCSMSGSLTQWEEPEFCKDLLHLSEEEYIKKLLVSIGR